MFDVGFWELTLLAVIGLIVLGPERLPVVARTLGLWVGRAKGYVRGLTTELEREVRTHDIREQVRQTREQIESDTRRAIEPARGAMSQKRPPAMSAGGDPADDESRVQPAPGDHGHNDTANRERE